MRVPVRRVPGADSDDAAPLRSLGEGAPGGQMGAEGGPAARAAAPLTTSRRLTEPVWNARSGMGCSFRGVVASPEGLGSAGVPALLDVDALHDLGDAGHLGGEAHGVVALLVVLENAGQRDDAAAFVMSTVTPH